MKKSIFLTGMLLPVLSYAQSDSIMRQKLLTASPRLGGITISNLVVPIKANGHTFTLQQPVADIGMPVYKNFLTKHPVFIRTGIRYQGLLLSNEKNIGSTNFHAITIPLLVSYSISRSTTIGFLGSVSVASDFKRRLQAKDIQYTAGVRMGFQQNKSFKFGITAMYVNTYAGQYLLPVPDIDWTITKKWNLTAFLPYRASLKYKLSPSQSLGVTAGINGSMYRLNDDDKREQYLHLRQTAQDCCMILPWQSDGS